MRDAATDRDRLHQVTKERTALEADLTRLRAALAEVQRTELASRLESIAVEVGELTERVEAQRSEVAEKVAESEECGRLRDLIENLPVVPNTCDLKEHAAESARESLATLESSLAKAEAAANVLGDPDLTTQQKLEHVGAEAPLRPLRRNSTPRRRSWRRRTLRRADWSGPKDRASAGWSTSGCGRGAG